MEQDILFVGIEVDDNAYHVALISKSKETFEFRSKAAGAALVKKLNQFTEKGYELQCCYEATYLGFSLFRYLQKHGFHCEVIAPSSIPRPPGPRVKTDKVDCRKLAEYYLKDLLTIVNIPDEQDETVRGLIRSRNFLAKQLRSTRSHLQLILRTQGLNFREDVGSKTAHYWTPKHWLWLESKIAKTSDAAFKTNITWLIEVIRSQINRIENYDTEIEKWAQNERYKEAVEALRCYRGIDTHTAMTLKTEIGDANRFSHPAQLTSFSGMDITEYSSGSNKRQYRITKNGNRHIRTASVETCQYAIKSPRVSKDLRKRREDANPKYIEIADRCMSRLYKKATHLNYRGKEILNVVPLSTWLSISIVPPKDSTCVFTK